MSGRCKPAVCDNLVLSDDPIGEQVMTAKEIESLSDAQLAIMFYAADEPLKSALANEATSRGMIL